LIIRYYLKLNHFRVRGVDLDWFADYLNDRTQQVAYNGIKSSDWNTITSSVPQGSILGPLLFILFMNDFSNSLKHSSSISFADDTNVLVSGASAKETFINANAELKIYKMNKNKLTIYKSKIKYAF